MSAPGQATDPSLDPATIVNAFRHKSADLGRGQVDLGQIDESDIRAEYRFRGWWIEVEESAATWAEVPTSWRVTTADDAPLGFEPHVPQWHAVALDVTEHCTFRDEHRPYVTAIWDVYFYDGAEAVHLCELTPSHHLRHLYTAALTTPECPEAMRDEIGGIYCHGDTDDTYMHVAAVERYIAAHPDRHREDTEPRCLTESAMREHWQGNCPL